MNSRRQKLFGLTVAEPYLFKLYAVLGGGNSDDEELAGWVHASETRIRRGQAAGSEMCFISSAKILSDHHHPGVHSSLRERTDDIPLLANETLGLISVNRGCGEVELGESAMAVLQHYPWPGNIREVRNVLERAAQIAQHPVLTVRNLELQYSGTLAVGNNGNGHGNGMHETNGNHLTLREVEARYIESVLQEEEGSIDRTARRLGISRSSLHNKVKNKDLQRRPTEAPALLPFAN